MRSAVSLRCTAKAVGRSIAACVAASSSRRSRWATSIVSANSRMPSTPQAWQEPDRSTRGCGSARALVGGRVGSAQNSGLGLVRRSEGRPLEVGERSVDRTARNRHPGVVADVVLLKPALWECGSARWVDHEQPSAAAVEGNPRLRGERRLLRARGRISWPSRALFNRSVNISQFERNRHVYGAHRIR